ncbi:MAG: sodium:solute symporter [Thermoplasmata archaeon]|nr:sodium:solute symporter [Thermoplasmata archaeon]
MLGLAGITVFVALFAVFIFLGFYARRWRKGDLTKLDEWSLGGRRFGAFVVWFLVGADLYTAYTFIAIPSSVFSVGAIFFYAVPYVSVAFGIAMWAMPKLWKVSKEKGYVTAADFVKDNFNSRNLAILVAVVGIVAELPYIALQIVGMLSVLTVMLYGISNLTMVSDIALILSFIILAIFTYTSGLRGATLTAIFKDILILTTVALVIVIVAIAGNFHAAFSSLPVKYSHLLPLQVNAYWSLFLMSALALYLYPHAVTGSLSSKDRKSLRLSQSLLPLYGVGLAFLALFGILVYANHSAISFLTSFPATSRGTYVVPGLIIFTLPDWLAGLAFLGIFIGGLVPAAIMAIAQGNLLTRNIIKEIAPKIKPTTETKVAKYSTVIFAFIALGFVFLFPLTYSVQLQLLGGILILQTLPSVFLGLMTNKLSKYSLMTGLLVGIGLGIYLMEIANKFSTWTTTLITTEFGPLFIGLIALAVNVAIVIVWSLIALAIKK